MEKEKWSKRKNIECMTLNNIANIKNHPPHVHFINNNKISLVLTLWKGGETSSTTSLLLIRTSTVPLVVSGKFPYSLAVVVFFARMKSDSRIITYSLQHGRVLVVVTSPD